MHVNFSNFRALDLLNNNCDFYFDGDLDKIQPDSFTA